MQTTSTPVRAGRITLAIIAAMALAAPLAAQCPAPASPALGMPADAIRYLSSDALEGRLAGSPGARCAGDYIARQFRQLGLQPAGDHGTYFQSLPLASTINPHAPATSGRNVIARLQGSDPRLKDQVVVLGAHYDHLGRGPFGSLAPDSVGAIHNGADDNASGVGALIQVARDLAAGPPPARSVVFVAFTGEEFGLVGSSYYVAHPAAPLDSTQAMINMDMVGRLQDKPLIIYGTGTAKEWPGLVEQAAHTAAITISEIPDGYGPSDQTSFYARDIPVLMFFTNTHEDYHKPTDDFEKIDTTGVRRVAALVASVARTVADRPARLTLQLGAGKPAEAQADSRGYGAYLGSVPDFTPVDYGVRLSGVRDDSPADKAGIRAGDIIVRFGTMDIKDLYALTDALRAHKPGDSVPVTVLREGRKITVQVTLASRGSGGG
ncbi:MAG: M28 family peptidase [Gemmatimonadota bacterium]